MSVRVFNVLFLCTGNSARSIMAEAILNHRGPGANAKAGSFRAFSAGSHPAGEVNPLAIATLQRAGLPTAGLRSKSWDEFAAPGAPELDFVFTVCSKAAAEVCPVWPGQPMTAHWGVDDPAALSGSESQRAKAFQEALVILSRRIGLMMNLPLEKLGGLSLKQRLGEIGRS